jgi:hypothetical protein
VLGSEREVFDSVYVPHLGGGGGALDNDNSGDGLSGGGVIEIEAGEVVLDGELRARGLDSGGSGRASGAGGTVVVEAGSLTGTGLIDVSGGFVSTCSGSSTQVGSGGGGRVGLYVDGLSGFDVVGQVRAWGGMQTCPSTIYRYAGPGTVYVKDQGATYGKLIVRHGGTGGPSPPNTVLPAIGVGTVGSTEIDSVDAADLWIEPLDTAALFPLGAHGMVVRADGADYLVLAQSLDRRRLLLAGAAGLVDVGDAYRGVYKFDQVVVRGGARLEFRDTNEVGSFDVDASSAVIQNVP